MDLHARRLYVCILNQGGELMLHHPMNTSPETFLKALAPSREDLVVAVECILTWAWLADLCAQEQRPLVLGHACSMNALHGGTAKPEKIDAQNIAGLRRGRRRPQADVDPAARRATRDRLRRRRHLTRQRAELRAHLQNPNRQSNLPEIGKKLAYKANREGVGERCSDPAVQKRVEVDRALIGCYDQVLSDVELTRVQTAKPHEAHPWSRLQSVPGLGKMVRVVLLYDIQDRSRFPRLQDGVSSCPLLKGAQESAGQRYGTAGAKSGQASLRWAFSEAAVRVPRNNPLGQP